MSGKKGNQNALKHGIYSKFIAVREDAEMEGMSDENPKDELTVARVSLANAMERRKNAKDDDTYWKSDYACHYWVERIADIKFRKLDKRQSEKAIFVSLIEAVRAANDKQNVVK